MKEQLVSFDTAKLAKEKGFDWRTTWKCQEDVEKPFQIISIGITSYKAEDPIIYSSPSQSLLQKWLREVHNIIVESTWEGTYEITSWNYHIYFLGNKKEWCSSSYLTMMGGIDADTYEEALEEGLKQGLSLIK